MPSMSERSRSAPSPRLVAVLIALLCAPGGSAVHGSTGPRGPAPPVPPDVIEVAAGPAGGSGPVVPIRHPGAEGLRVRIAPAQLDPASRLEVFTSSSVLYQVLSGSDLAGGALVPRPDQGDGVAPAGYLDGDTIHLRLTSPGGARVVITGVEAAIPRPWASALAARWAPHVFQDVDASDRRADLVTAIDFDGDFNGDNNWANLWRVPELPLGGRPEHQAAAYWWVAQSRTHHFIGYAFFHPRDWKDFPPWGGERFEHENDSEGILLTVRRLPGDPMGRLELMQTIHHANFRQYIAPGTSLSARDARTGHPTSAHTRVRETVDGPIEISRGRPVIYIEAKGHGITGRPFEHPIRGPHFDGLRGDGVVYRAGSYALKPIAPIWRLAQDSAAYGPGRLFHDRWRFQGASHGEKHKARPPWGWADDDYAEIGYPGGRGTLFTDPGGLLLWQFALHPELSPRLINRSWDDEEPVGAPPRRGPGGAIPKNSSRAP